MKWIERLFQLYSMVWTARHKVRSTELHALKAYVHAVRLARVSMIALLAFMLTALVITIGGTAFIAGVLMLLPLSFDQRLWCLVGVGALLCFGPLLLLTYILSDSVWLEKSGILRLLDNVQPESPASKAESEPASPEPVMPQPMAMSDWDLSQTPTL